MQKFQAREIAFGLKIEPNLIARAADTIIGCYRAFSELDATMVEVNQWTEQFQNYIKMGYRNNSPAKGVSIHLGPLLHTSWLQSLETKEITYLIQEEGKLRMPCDQRRLQLLKANRNSNKHSDFLYQLETLMSVAELKDMIADEMVIYPESVFPAWAAIPVAIAVGVLIRRKVNLLAISIIGVTILYFTIYVENL